MVTVACSELGAQEGKSMNFVQVSVQILLKKEKFRHQNLQSNVKMSVLLLTKYFRTAR